MFLACSLLIIVFSYVLMTAECSSTATRSRINNRISQTFASSSCPLVFYAYPPSSTFMYKAFSLQKELKNKIVHTRANILKFWLNRSLLYWNVFLDYINLYSFQLGYKGGQFSVQLGNNEILSTSLGCSVMHGYMTLISFPGCV